MRPQDATYTDSIGNYYKVAPDLGYLRWDCGEWLKVDGVSLGMLTPLPLSTACKVQHCELHRLIGSDYCLSHGAAPAAADQLTEAKRLLLNLFEANDGCANNDSAASQWLGSPMRAEIERFLKPELVEAQLQRDRFMYGKSYALRNADGTLTRLDPALIVMQQGKP